MRDESGREYSDFQFEENFEPCDRKPWPLREACGSMVRVARVFPEARRVGFQCDQGHKLKWNDRGLWIPLDVFGEDGDYAGMVPATFLPSRTRPGLSTSITISNTADYRARTSTECCVCDCPPFNDQPLQTQLFEIYNHKRFLYQDIFPYVAAMIKAKKYSDEWFATLPEDLKSSVRLAARESKIQADHGVPRDILLKLWPILSSKERSVATNALAFPLCGFCNKGKRHHLDSTDVIVKRFAKVRYGGNEVLAAKDDSYPHILSICAKAQAYRLEA